MLFIRLWRKQLLCSHFDLVIVHAGENGDYSQYSSFLNERIDVDNQYSYCLYTDKTTQFTDIRNRALTEYWNRAGKTVSVNDYVIAENQYDAFMKYSDYCNLRAMLGLSQIPLSEEQYIIHCLPYLKDTFINLQIEEGSLVCKDIFTEAFSQYGGYGNGQDFVIVVPDHYIKSMEAMYSLYAVQSETVIDMSELENEFSQVRPLSSNVVASGENGYTTKILDKGDYYYTGKLASTPTSQAILIILPLCYLSLVIGIISTACPRWDCLSPAPHSPSYAILAFISALAEQVILCVSGSKAALWCVPPWQRVSTFLLQQPAPFSTQSTAGCQGYKQKFHQAEILLGAAGNEPITLKVEPRTPNKPSKGLSHPAPPGRE
mgnify:CR=1 FL=1